MATPVTLDTIWQYRVNYTMWGQRFITTMNLQLFGSSPPVTDYEARASAFLTFQEGITGFLAKVAACISEKCVIDNHEIQPVYPTRYRAVQRVVAMPGGQVGAALPTNTSQVITKTSVFATRWGVGSMHLPPGDITGLSAGTGKWTILQFGLINTVALHVVGPWLSDNLADIWRPVLWNQAVPARVTEITSAITHDTARVERRRTVGLGI